MRPFFCFLRFGVLWRSGLVAAILVFKDVENAYVSLGGVLP